MLIHCPACDARYAVDDALIGAVGRAVRCSACDAEWTVRPGEDAAIARPESAGAADTRRGDGRPVGVQAPTGRTAQDEIGAERRGEAPRPSDSRDHALASTLEPPGARRGGGGFLAGFALSTTAAVLAALAYLRAEDIAASVPAVAPQIEHYRASIDTLRAEIAAALAAAR